MAVTDLRYTKAGARSWKLTWTGSAGGPYYIYRNGVLMGTTYATSIVITVAPGENPIITVTDVAGDVPDSYPDRVTIGWRSVTGATKYVVQQYTGGSWVSIQEIPHDGRACYTWRSPALDDLTAYTYGVLPYSGLVAGTRQSYAVLMVRYPDPPRVSYSYSAATRKVTVTARA